MTNEEIAVALEGFGHEIGSLKHRMKTVEKEHEALNKMATAVEVMAGEQRRQSETMTDIKRDITALGSKVDVIEKKPGRRWDKTIETILAAIVTGVVCFFLGRFGM